MRDAVRDARGEAVVTTQSSIMGRGSGKFCRTVKEKRLSEEVSSHGCAHKAGDRQSTKAVTAKGCNSLHTSQSCIRGRYCTRHRVQVRPYPPVSNGRLLCRLCPGYQMPPSAVRVKTINLERLFPKTRDREPVWAVDYSGNISFMK